MPGLRGGKMGKQMTFFIFIGMFQGVVSETKAFRKEEQAIKAFDDYTGEDYVGLTADPDMWAEFHECNDKYTGSMIHELHIEP